MAATERPLRADAERNLQRIVAAATEAFARDGLEAGVDAIAKQAGVGVGTLYRRFPTKADLIAAVIEARTKETVRLIREIDEPDPGRRLAAAARVVAERTAMDRGVFDTLVAELSCSETLDGLRSELLAALEPPLEAAQAAGVIRDDIAAGDLLAILASVARIAPRFWDAPPDLWTRYLVLVLDGLNPRVASPLPHAPPPRRLGGR